ncbi:hypothetical protein EAI_03687 [Harpegnathos saltator]|uniref:Uncharacterized protein n=2 Tax=Harpegnathos saltator TaxID=610380 RepID=E2BCB8_HARSA|nr:hypothetical protein EAI_03687 [Harpegnathos saltator]
MTTTLRLQCLIIIGLSLQPRFSHGFPVNGSPYYGVKIVTHGEPCHTPHYLPVKIEVPAQPVEESIPQEFYQPLKLSYQTFGLPPPSQYLYPISQYPISIEMPPEAPSPKVPSCKVSLPTKSYEYNVQIPPPPTEQIPISYDFDLQVLPPNP